MIPFVNNRYLRALWKTYARVFAVTGRWIAALTFVLFFYGLSTWPSSQLFVPLMFALGLWTIAAICAIFYRPRMKIKIRPFDTVTVGSALNGTATIEQCTSFARFGLRFLPAKLPNGMRLPNHEGAEIPVLARNASAEIRFQVQCDRRGIFNLRIWRVQTSFPLDVVFASRSVVQECRLVVTPRFTPLSSLNIPLGSRYQSGGHPDVYASGKSYDYAGNREYRSGDNIGHIDWSATARLHTTIIREYRDEYFHRVGLIFDSHATEKHRIVSKVEFESAISLAAAVSDRICRDGLVLQLFCRGPEYVSGHGANGSETHSQVMVNLADARPDNTSHFETMLASIEQQPAQITSWVLVLLDWNEERRSFVDFLASSGASVTAFVVRDLPPTVPYNLDGQFVRVTGVTTEQVSMGAVE